MVSFKTMKKTLGMGLVGIVVVSLNTVGLAAPLKRGDVSGQAAWMVHLDCDGLRPTTVGKYVLSELEKPEAQSKLEGFQTMFGFDPRTQLHGLTLYGTGSTPREGVLVVYADADPDRLVTLAKSAKDAEDSKYKEHTIYSWLDEKKHGSHRVYAALDKGRVIFGQNSASVGKALDVLDEITPSLDASKEFPELGARGDKNFLEAAVRHLDLPESHPNAAILRLSKLLRLQLGETDGRVQGTLTMEANDDEVAGNIASIAQGLVALMKLQKDKPEAVKVGEAISLKQNGDRVTLSLSVPGEQAVALMKADAARKAAKRAQQEEREKQADQ